MPLGKMRARWVRAYNRWVVPLKSVSLKNEGFLLDFDFFTIVGSSECTWRFGCHDQGEIDPIGSFLRAAAQMEETCSNRNYVIFLPSLILVTFIALIELNVILSQRLLLPISAEPFSRVTKISWKYNFPQLDNEYHIRDFWGSSIKLVIDYLHSQA